MRQSGNLAPSLPWDVVSLILKQCDPKTLKAITLTSKAMRFEADRCLFQMVQYWYHESAGQLPPFLPSERAMHVKEILVAFLDNPSESGLVMASEFRQIMERVVNASTSLRSLTIFLEINQANPCPPTILDFKCGVLNDLINHPCPQLVSLHLEISGTHEMLLHPQDLEILCINHPLLERLTIEAPLSWDTMDLDKTTPGFPKLQELEVSDIAHFHLARGCCLRHIRLKLGPLMTGIELMFAEVEAFSQTLTELSLDWQGESSSNVQQGFNELIRGAFFTNLPMLEVLSFHLPVIDGVTYFDLDMEAEGTLSATLLHIRRLGLNLQLRSLSFAHVSTKSIERFTQAVFRNAPSSLEHLEVLFPPGWDYSTNEVKVGERHMIDRLITGDGYMTLLHTLIPSGNGQDFVQRPKIYLATRQTLIRKGQNI
ncbi:hypothetical protein DL93DRAFT_2157171 [Clavulina sp. PMI_390]|nr:hypothetical protein DL93DRAFT_2157171 [Clavulina sp. PMI_390]